jgi:hypothetical protein
MSLNISQKSQNLKNLPLLRSLVDKKALDFPRYSGQKCPTFSIEGNTWKKIVTF